VNSTMLRRCLLTAAAAAPALCGSTRCDIFDDAISEVHKREKIKANIMWGPKSVVVQAATPGILGSRKSPTQTDMVRVVLTGGPCAGKSSALAKIKERASQKGFDVYVAPESATILFSNGCQWSDDPVDQERFMKAIVLMQLQIERTFTMIASSTRRPSILIVDRGILDNKGYISPEGWNRTMKAVDKVLLEIEFTESYVLGRYDAVIHMCTAAKGAEKYYKSGWTTDDSGNKVYRRETAEMARELDDNMISCWEAHPRHYVVPNDDKGFEAKLDAVSNVIIAVAQEKHPQPAKK